MPNWCTTTITITGKEKEIETLWDKLQEATSKNYVENGFGKTWLGNIVEYMGVSHEKVRCRGLITFMDKNEDEITIDTETAWSVMLEPFNMMIEKFAPEAELVYEATEPGCCLYLTNDPTVNGKYLLDLWDEYELPECLQGLNYEYLSEEDLSNLLKEALGIDKSEKIPIGKLIKNACDKWEDNLYINQFEWCDACDL